MKKIISISIILTLCISICFIPSVSAEKQTFKNVLCFGDSIMQGYSGLGAKESNWADYFGDARFSCLLAEEYGAFQKSDATSYINHSLAGAFIGDLSYWQTNHSSSAHTIYESQVLTTSTEEIKNADLIILDGGINDTQFVAGFEFYDTKGGTTKLNSETKAVNRMTADEVKAYIEKYKSMTDEDVANYISTYSRRAATLSWKGAADRVFEYYDKIVTYLNSNGFNGKITLQNTVNPYQGDNTSCETLWSEIIDYCLSQPMKLIEQKYDNVVFVDLANLITDGNKASGIGYYDHLHLSRWGNYEVYKCLSQALNPDNTEFVEYHDDTAPDGAKWITLLNFDDYTASDKLPLLIGGELCGADTPSVAVDSVNNLYFSPSKISLDISKYADKIYGVKYKIFTAGSSSFTEFINGASALRSGTKQKNSYTGSAWTSTTIQVGDHLISPTDYTTYSYLVQSDISNSVSLDFYRLNSDTRGIYIYDVEILVDSDENITGDVNSSGSFDIKDVLSSKKYLVGYDISANKTLGDLDSDGTFNIKDILQMQKRLAKI